MVPAPSLYDEVVTVTARYFGPATDQFVVRQIRNHLHKDPIELHAPDLGRLIEWIRLTMHLVGEDVETVDRYIRDLERLAAGGTGSLE